MKRIILKDESMNRVIELRESGKSWLGIEKELRINRHVAKRNYEEWEQKQSADDLKGVRLKVAEEEFKQHLNHLTKIAEFLVNNLSLPTSPNSKNAKHFLDMLWRNRIIEEPSFDIKTKGRDNRQTQRITRQNQLLFQSLKDHTCEKVRWEALNEWRSGWDNSIAILNNLRGEFNILIVNILNQRPELLSNLQKGQWGIDTTSQMVSKALSAVWKGSIDDSLLTESLLVKTKFKVDGGGEITSVDVGEGELLQFNERKTGEEFVEVLNWAITNLRKGDKSSLLRELSIEVKKMERAIRELEDALNPLLIRPLILRSKCNLCPV